MNKSWTSAHQEACEGSSAAADESSGLYKIEEHDARWHLHSHSRDAHAQSRGREGAMARRSESGRSGGDLIEEDNGLSNMSSKGSMVSKSGIGYYSGIRSKLRISSVSTARHIRMAF
jgi:hypothetical protein